MRQSALALGVFLLLSSTSALGATARGEMVSYPSGEETISGFLVLPEGAGPHPALVVIQEWWGLNDWVKEQAQKLADEGYVALAVDLYRGKVATNPEEAHELMRGMPQDRAIRDLKATFAYLAARKDVNRNKIGSCVVNYGSMPTDPADIQKIRAPILGSFGAEDRGISPESVRAFEKAMKAADKKLDVKIYEGAGHAFQNPNNQSGYRPEATADSWNRTLAFLNRTLK